ncbi:MAG: hypothetical protein EG828_16290, partial [Deltaproteobacteria bacterium]|nr:hypothetical protein [Deltaproteobacteria bacterium]
MKGACEKCHNKQQCHRPCWFVESLLSRVTDGSLERKTGDTITYYGRYWEKQWSAINEAVLEKAVFEASREQPEAAPDSEPMDRRPEDLEFVPKQKTADIVFMRLFLG